MVEVRSIQHPKRSNACILGPGVEPGKVGGAAFLNISARDFDQGQLTGSVSSEARQSWLTNSFSKDIDDIGATANANYNSFVPSLSRIFA